MNYVGSSGVLLETGSERIVMDYGTEVQDTPPSFPMRVNGNVDAVLLGHAHLDHCGGLPLVAAKSKCPVYAASPSKLMVNMLLNDSLKIARNEGLNLPFNKQDVESTIRRIKHVDFRKPFNVGKSKVTGYRAGHIPGSTMFLVDSGSKKVLYTSDFNMSDTRLMKAADTDIPEVDALIIESTYSERDHSNRESNEKALVKTIESTLANDGIALISSFAIGRTQEVLLVLDSYGIDYPLYMDGMAKKATTIINGSPNSMKDKSALDKALRKVKYVTNINQRKKSIKNPCVIMTTSGMLSGGPVVWYIQNLYNDHRNNLVLTGYQVEDTPGRILMDTGRFVFEDSESKERELKLKMGVNRLEFSAHADRKEILSFIEKANPKKVFCVHGDNTPKFAQELCGKGYDAVAPVLGESSFDLK